MLLTTHRSKKNPEVIHSVYKNENDAISCNCPKCLAGGVCYVRQQFLDRQFRDRLIFAKVKYEHRTIRDIREVVQESLVAYYGVSPGPDKAPYPPPWRFMMR